MARICSEKAAAMAGGRFDLVLIASQRTRELKNGSAPMVDKVDNREVVIALREIEEGKIDPVEYLAKYGRQQRKEHRYQ
jgi:DNA-directed RNA polymerase subunit omega